MEGLFMRSKIKTKVYRRNFSIYGNGPESKSWEHNTIREYALSAIGWGYLPQDGALEPFI